MAKSNNAFIKKQKEQIRKKKRQEKEEKKSERKKNSKGGDLENMIAYVDEYVFRFNRRNKRESIFNAVIDRMMQQIPHPYKVIKKICAYYT